MLTAHNLSKSYGIIPILKNITFSINGGDRIGLIGPNGAGKSTLIRILAGVETPDSGHVTANTGGRIGYLSQGFEPDPTLTLSEIISQASGDAAALENKLIELGEKLAADPNNPAVQQAYDDVLDRLMQADGSDHGAILDSLGLAQLSDNTPVGILSGGQKMRLSLALLLISNPQVLLLDEPTNHLDIEMLEWLEEWLSNFSGGVFIVSHDRTFLDRVSNRIIDLDPATQTTREYTGNYTNYLEQKQKELQKHTEAWKEQEYQIRRMRQDIHRTKHHAKSVELTTKPNQPNVRRLAKKVAKKAKSRERKLERYLDSDDRVEKPKSSWQVKIEFEQQHLGKQVLELTDLAVGFDKARPLIASINEEIQLGQRVVLTGPNGTGKTTLLRTIAKKIEPLAGHIKLGGNIKLGYMSQEQEHLDPSRSALEHLQSVVSMNQTDARSYLHYYLFKDDDSLRPINDLSFGERARLTLAGLVAQGCNFLLLDEPINHLDIPSRTLFEGALKNFNGTVLAVVHDRYFVQSFATEIWWVKQKNEGSPAIIEREILALSE
ncbi:MAG: ABC-F family ATP-binding cassette domain-containing protein [Chloroflexota bacterium]